MTFIIGFIDNYKHYRRKGHGRWTAMRRAVRYVKEGTA